MDQVNACIEHYEETLQKIKLLISKDPESREAIGLEKSCEIIEKKIAELKASSNWW